MKHTANEVGRLFHNGYLSRHFNPTKLPGEGGDAFIYTVTPDGARIVLSPEEWAQERHSIYRRAEEKQNYNHALSVSSLQAILELGADKWALEEFISDHEDQSKQTKVEIRGRGRRTIWPDAEAIVRLPRGDRLLFLFELDRTHRSYKRLEERFAAYAIHVSGTSLQRLRTERDVAGAAVVFAGPFDAPNYFKLKHAVLRAHNAVREHTSASARPSFLFWNTDRWYQDQVEGSGPRLRDPRDILAEENVVDLAGRRRRLIVTG